MRIIFLGTGTSVGVPMIGCGCAVCASADPRNKRRRTSLYIAAGGVHVVVDTPPDFREQMLAFRVPRVDAVLFTHSHADHIFGFDDIRRFNTIQGAAIPAYSSRGTLADLKRIFDYVECNAGTPDTYLPEVDFRGIDGPFDLGGLHVAPLGVIHGRGTTLGFRFECEGRTLGYVPDCGAMPDDTLRGLAGVDVMILDGLRHRPHPTHLTVERSVALLERIGAKRSYLIHLCHDLDHEETQRALPAGMFVSYDGLTLEW
jgi:phosphoribosyl 1,2-cyclic phosphate phosphodiesterase